MPAEANAATAAVLEDIMIGHRSVVPTSFNIDLGEFKDATKMHRLSSFSCDVRLRRYLANTDEARFFDKELAKTDAAFSKYNLVTIELSTGSSAMYALTAISMKYTSDDKRVMAAMMPLANEAAYKGFLGAIDTLKESKLQINEDTTYTKYVFVLDLTCTLDALTALMERSKSPAAAASSSSTQKDFLPYIPLQSANPLTLEQSPLIAYPISETRALVSKLQARADRLEKQIENGKISDREIKTAEEALKKLKGQVVRGERRISTIEKASDEINNINKAKVDSENLRVAEANKLVEAQNKEIELKNKIIHEENLRAIALETKAAADGTSTAELEKKTLIDDMEALFIKLSQKDAKLDPAEQAIKDAIIADLGFAVQTAFVKTYDGSISLNQFKTEIAEEFKKEIKEP